jgi:hypothetical protein
MKTIWKFTLAVTDAKIGFDMPGDAEPLRFGMQNGVPCLWALVNLKNPTTKRYFRVYGTGHQIMPDSKYVGTCDDPPYVWHLFEQLNALGKSGGAP